MLALSQLRGINTRPPLLILLTCVLVVSLCATPAIPPALALISAAHTVSGNDLNHLGHKQCLEHDNVGIAAPDVTPVLEFIPQFTLPVPGPEPQLSLLTEGFHYNRPPPI